MTDITGHRDLQALLGAYALDAVDADEAEAIEIHLRECPRCRSEVQEHRETATFLAHSGQAAPEGGWDRLAASLEETPPQLDVSRLTSPARRAGGDATAGNVVVPQRWRRMAVLTTAAAAVVVLLAGLTVVRMNGRIDNVETASGVRDDALRAASDPDRREIRLASSTGGQAAEAVLLPDGRLYFIHDELAPVGSDRTYQVWGVLPDDRVVSLGLLGNDPDVAVLRADPTVKAVAITVEQAGGVVSSSNPPTASGTVPV